MNALIRTTALLALLAIAAPSAAQTDPATIQLQGLDLSGDDAQAAPEAAAPAPSEEAPAAAQTDEAAEPAEPDAAPTPAPAAVHTGSFRQGMLVGAKVGAGFGQLMSPFGTAFVPELEVGFAPNASFVVFLSGQYAAPVTEGTTAADPRLPGSGELHYSITQNQLILTLGGSYRLDVGSDLLRPYASIGARLYLMRSDVTADGGGETFGPNAETATSYGAFGALGVEAALGPGSLTGELQLGWAPLDLYVLRGTSTGSLNVVVGYRLYF